MRKVDGGFGGEVDLEIVASVKRDSWMRGLSIRKGSPETVTRITHRVPTKLPMILLAYLKTTFGVSMHFNVVRTETFFIRNSILQYPLSETFSLP